MGFVVRRYIDILIIIINFPYSTCISSFFGSSIPTSLFILKMFFWSLQFTMSIHIRRTHTKNNIGSFYSSFGDSFTNKVKPSSFTNICYGLATSILQLHAFTFY